MTSLAKIRALALAATPGPWSVGEDERECAATLRAQPIRKTDGMPNGDPVEVIIPFGRAYSDAAYIAALSPDVVVGLLDQNADLQAANAELAHIADKFTMRFYGASQGLDTDVQPARDRIQELRKVNKP